MKSELEKLDYNNIYISTLPADDPRNYRMDCSLINSIGLPVINSLEFGIQQMAGWIKNAVGNMYNLDDSRYYTIKLWKKWVEKYGTNPIL